MPINCFSVTLLAPGCFSAVAQAQDDGFEPAAVAVSPDLNEASAISTNTQAYEQALAAVLRQPVPDMGDIPVALHQFPVDAGMPAPAHCVCAEFIHLQADKDNARLVPEPALTIADDESSQLLEALNDLIAADGLKVQRTVGGRCYMIGMPATGLDAWPAHAVANGKIANYLPRRADAGDWRRFLTEVQMLFHAHPVNVARAESRQLSINGMWFWGGNQNLQLEPVANTVVVTDDAYALGLSAALDLEVRSLASSDWTEIVQRYGQHPDIEHVVIVDHGAYNAWLRGDHAALLKAKQRLQEQWITPIQQAVTDGAVAQFQLDGCEGQAIVERQASASAADATATGWLARFSLKRFFSSKER